MSAAPAALLIVRAVVSDPADRTAFDHWYAQEHLPEARAAFRARRAWRAWSEQDPAIHWAFYELDSLEAGRAIPGSAALRALIAEFDRRWTGRVSRTRDLVRLVQTLPEGAQA